MYDPEEFPPSRVSLSPVCVPRLPRFNRLPLKDMNSTSNIWWIGPLMLTLLRLLYWEARLTHANRQGTTLIFRGAKTLRLLFGLGIIGFSVLIMLSIGHEEKWIRAGSTGFVIAWCFGWPPTITTNENGLHRHVWWKPAITIPWADVSAIERNVGGDLQVFGKNGECIRFTRYHIDPFRFEDEVKRRAHSASTLDSSAPPSLRI
jgi:hypothetical protein